MKLTIIPHITRYDDDWGVGQLDTKTIYMMIKVGNKIGLTFTFAKKVTAFDDEYDMEEKTITIEKTVLFSLPGLS